MASKKRLKKFKVGDAEGFTPIAKTIGSEKTPLDREGNAGRINIYVYPRDRRKFKELQEMLKDRFGDVSVSQLLRFALHTANFDNYRNDF